jgi:hypothetical protein
MAGIKLDRSLKSGLATVAGTVLLIIGVIVQIIHAAQTGELRMGIHMGFNITSISIVAAILFVLGCIVLTIGIVSGLWGENK